MQISSWNFNLRMPSSVINPCYPNIPFLYPFKISENQGFSDVSKRVYKWSIGVKWVNKVPNLKFLFKNNKGNTGKTFEDSVLMNF